MRERTFGICETSGNWVKATEEVRWRNIDLKVARNLGSKIFGTTFDFRNRFVCKIAFLPERPFCHLFVISAFLIVLKNWAIPGLFFFIFVLSTVSSKYAHYRILLVTGFEPWISGIGGDRSANWATTTALPFQ